MKQHIAASAAVLTLMQPPASRLPLSSLLDVDKDGPVIVHHGGIGIDIDCWLVALLVHSFRCQPKIVSLLRSEIQS